jgi:hypothetical protein
MRHYLLLTIALATVACSGEAADDAGTVVVRPDAGAGTDAGSVDGGASIDGGGSTDGGAIDGGAPIDGGETDGGGESDGGESDGGAPWDAGPCTTIVGGRFDVDLSTVTLTGRLTVNGAMAVNSGGEVYLHHPATGDEARLGDPRDATYSARVVPGVYDIRYRYGTTYLFQPGTVSNTNFLIRSGVVVDADATLDVDVPAVEVTGALSIDGAPVEGWGGGYLELRDPVTGDTARVADYRSASYRALVHAGTYDVYYVGSTESGLLRNQNMRVRQGVVVGAATTIDVDLESVQLTGNLTTPRDTVFQHGGFVELRTAAGDRARLGSVYRDGTLSTTYYADVAPGTYDAYYVMPDSDLNSAAVRNEGALFQRDVVVSGDARLDIEVPAIYLTGRFTVNGITARSGGRVYIRNAATGDEAFLGFPNEDSYTASIVPGIYDLYYVTLYEDGARDTLRNRDTLLRSGVDLTVSGRFDHDMVAVQLTGMITVGGVELTSGLGRVSLWRGEQDHAWLGYVSEGMFRALVLPGVYELVYDGARVPYDQHEGVRNDFFTLRSSVTITGSGTMDIDVPATRIEGRLTVDGTNDVFPRSLFFLRRAGSTDEAFLGEVSGFETSYTARVRPGVYHLVHTGTGTSSSRDDVRNQRAVLQCVVVP